MNEKFYTFIMSLITIVIVYFATQIDIPAIRIFASSLQSLALWQFANVVFIMSLYGFKFDVVEEIIENKNLPLATLCGLFAIGSAIVIQG